MASEVPLRDVLRNLLSAGDLSFRDFMEMALYHPRAGYYARSENPIGTSGDFITAPSLSPAFSFAIGRLVREFVSRSEGAMCSIVDIGCGDGSLIRELAARQSADNLRFFGVDRSLERAGEGGGVTFVATLDELPREGVHLLFSNELFDAFPFARLVRRGEHLHELWVTEREGELDWTERDAPPQYAQYFAARGIELAEGQFADVSLEWEAYYGEMLRVARRGLIVTIDYGFPQPKLFDARIRRFGTAAAYAGQRVTRDLLADPGRQDLTAHVNFTGLEHCGEREGASTLFFDRLAKFLLAIGITEHELFRPVEQSSVSSSEEAIALLGARDDARRLVLPDGMGEDLRVLVQSRLMPVSGWSFQRPLF